MKQFGCCGLFMILLCCSNEHRPTLPQHAINTIAFGSCNKEYEPQPFWPVIAAENPDVWIWLGDNIYADTDDMSLMAKKYRQQLKVPEYQQFASTVPITGIWDDHDYGMNDGNRTFSKKHQAKEQFMQFMNLEPSHSMSDHEGIYHSMQFGLPPQQIKLILLDTRTFQDPLVKLPSGGSKNYKENQGTVLGKEQWQWLTNELKQSKANINLIASSIQVIAEDHRYEMWSNFPNERTQLLDLIAASKVKNPIILSGDRHLSEISKIHWQGQDIYDITASGMTHSFSGNEEYNSHRLGQLVVDESFSTLEIDWYNKSAKVSQFSIDGKVLNQIEIQLSD
ncbi:MAG: alkaline phosphatase D family protein [Marinicella sp.]